MKQLNWLIDVGITMNFTEDGKIRRVN